MLKILDNLSPSRIKLSQLARKPGALHNFFYNEFGQLEKRKGYSTYGASIGGTYGIKGMHRAYRQDTSIKEFYAAWHEGIYLKANTTPYGATLIKLGLTSGNDTYFVDFLNHTYFVNGVDGVFKCSVTDAIAGTRTSDTIFTRTAGTWAVDSLIGQYLFSYVSGVPTVGTWLVIADNDAGTVTITGTLHASANRIKIAKVRTVGITVPTAGTLNTLMDGALGTGDYQFRITYVDENGYESNGGTAVTIAVEAHPTDGVVLNIPVSGDKKIVYRNIYRTALNGEIFYYDGQVADNTTTTHNSVQADDTLGTILSEISTAPPATPHLITKRRNKLYLGDADYLYPSQTSNVEYFPLAWRKRTGNSQKITGLLEQLFALPVFTDDSVERLIGTDYRNFEFRNAYSTEGNIAIRSLVNCENLLVYLGYNGINWHDGTTTGIFSKALNKYIQDNIVDAYRHLSCAVYWKDKYILCYPKTGTVPSETIWVDLKNKTYGVSSFAFGCFSKWDRGTDGLQLKGGSSTIGQVYSVFDGTTDNGSAITAWDAPEAFDLGAPDIYKKWFSIYVKIKSTTASTLTMYYTRDDLDEESNERQLEYDDVAFVEGGSGADTITTEDGDFTEQFVAGDVLVITGTDSNNKTVTIVSLTATTITLATGQITTEAEGDAILTATLTTTANTTKWYRISLPKGTRARALAIKPYISDKYDATLCGYMIQYDWEKPKV